MAINVSRFNELVRGKRNIPTDFLPKISSKADFSRTEGISTILNSWTNILLTPLGSYIDDPTYGSELYKLIFEPADDITESKIIYEVQSRILSFDNRANIQNVEVSFISNQKGFDVNITVIYEGQERDLEITINEGTFFNFI